MPSAAIKRSVFARRPSSRRSTQGLGETEVLNSDGKLIAHGASSVIVLSGFGFPGNLKFPPKFFFFSLVIPASLIFLSL